ncbi:MAG: TRAP transporter large permease subunit [Proteobacteria bacterium]|nr:TRAP transporter large permease subunit [Pseudomonadota bacterium]
MIGLGAASLLIVGLVVLVALGVQVAVALGLVGLLGIWWGAGDWHAASAALAGAAYDGLRQPAYLVIPLLMLMGEFIARSGAVSDLFRILGREWRGLPSGATLAAMAGQGFYAFVSGASASSAAGFTRLTYPVLKRGGLDGGTALGALAAAAAFGALIPPSVLLAAWGLIAHQPIGALFLAAVVPAILLGAFIAAMTVSVAAKPGGATTDGAAPLPSHAMESAMGIAVVLIVILGGIGTRLLTPLEAASVGIVIGLLMALRKGMRLPAIVEAILVVGRASAPILLLIFTAQLYAQALTMTGAVAAIGDTLVGLGLGLGLAIMLTIWLFLSIMLDQLSIMALTVAVFAPAATRLGIDPLAFAVLGVITLEAAQLIPPFGLLVFTAKAAVEDDGVALPDIFRHVLPFLLVMLVLILLLAAFPGIATWLPHIAL